jgi:hypothetical protein
MKQTHMLAIESRIPAIHQEADRLTGIFWRLDTCLRRSTDP